MRPSILNRLYAIFVAIGVYITPVFSGLTPLYRLKDHALVRYTTNPSTLSHIMHDHSTGHSYSIADVTYLSTTPTRNHCPLVALYETPHHASLSLTPHGKAVGYCSPKKACGATEKLDLYYSRVYQQELVSWDEHEKQFSIPRGFAWYRKKRTLCYSWTHPV